jgi:N-acetylmuramoyl-L-alanine amidase
LEENYANTYEGFDPNSSESYIMFEMTQDIYMDQSLAFAAEIQHQFNSRLENSNRGVKQAGFLVLRQSSMPSVLVETGFISNQSEANYLKSEEGQQKIALSILDAFRKFKAKKSGVNIPVAAESKSKHDNQNITVTPETELVSKNGSVEIMQDTNQNEKPVFVEEKVTSTHENKTDEKTDLKTEDNTTVSTASVNNTATAANTYYSVQIGANTTPVDPVAQNFKGVKDVKREKTDKYYRYYVGKETSVENIKPILQKIKLKFPMAFIVSFVDGNRIIYREDSK